MGARDEGRLALRASFGGDHGDPAEGRARHRPARGAAGRVCAPRAVWPPPDAAGRLKACCAPRELGAPLEVPIGSKARAVKEKITLTRQLDLQP